MEKTAKTWFCVVSEANYLSSQRCRYVVCSKGPFHMALKSEPIFITAFGMATSLGLDWINSCAGARAGLSRPSGLGFQVVDADTSTL